MKIIDYQQLYYDEKYKNKKLLEEIEYLKDEIAILKGNKQLIEYIINKIKKLNENRLLKNKNN